MYPGLFEELFHCKLVSFRVYSYYSTAAGTSCDNSRRWDRKSISQKLPADLIPRNLESRVV